MRMKGLTRHTYACRGCAVQKQLDSLAIIQQIQLASPPLKLSSKFSSYVRSSPANDNGSLYPNAHGMVALWQIGNYPPQCCVGQINVGWAPIVQPKPISAKQSIIAKRYIFPSRSSNSIISVNSFHMVALHKIVGKDIFYIYCNFH